MIITPENLPPEEIERRSMAIIGEELGDVTFPPDVLPVVKRVIHTTADFEYAHALVFSDDAVATGLAALRGGRPLVTDTQMAAAGINKRACAEIGCAVHCLIADPAVAEAAKRDKSTRSRAAVDAAAERWPEGVYVVGNAPTALIRICELVDAGKLHPGLVVGAPVGFVNVVESKELLLAAGVPHIVARGRKGGSTVAAAIVNALLYMIARPA
ncbi:MAG: precorrin-8X methylmutase [Planctomycetaceae bacterium]|nr:precorrin-8X methylmutase [Planctomycetaceae bacterium]